MTTKEILKIALDRLEFYARPSSYIGSPIPVFVDGGLSASTFLRDFGNIENKLYGPDELPKGIRRPVKLSDEAYGLCIGIVDATGLTICQCEDGETAKAIVASINGNRVQEEGDEEVKAIGQYIEVKQSELPRGPDTAHELPRAIVKPL